MNINNKKSSTAQQIPPVLPGDCPANLNETVYCAAGLKGIIGCNGTTFKSIEQCHNFK